MPSRVDTAGLTAIACPSRVQCTAVDEKGREVTFEPTSRRSPSMRKIDTAGPTSVACPSLVQCTAVDDRGREVTFAPASWRKRLCAGSTRPA
jgi:hypothetical protein